MLHDRRSARRELAGSRGAKAPTWTVIDAG
jgi:hypothetical protein